MSASSHSAMSSVMASRYFLASSAMSAGISPAFTFPRVSSKDRAFICMRSITPLNASSAPMGMNRGVAFLPMILRTLSIALAKSARSRSILLMNRSRGRPYSSAASQTFSVWNSTPPTASMTTRAASATRRQLRVSMAKLASPGVSSRLIRCLSQSTKAAEALMEMQRFCSSGSQSMVDVPSSTRPRRSVFPVTKSMDSAIDVFPVPPCPTIAILRRDFESYFAIEAPFPPALVNQYPHRLAQRAF